MTNTTKTTSEQAQRFTSAALATQAAYRAWQHASLEAAGTLGLAWSAAHAAEIAEWERLSPGEKRDLLDVGAAP